MTPKLLRRFYLKQNAEQRNYIGAWQTNACYITPFLLVENIMCNGKTYLRCVRFGWLFWCLEYVASGYNDAESQRNKARLDNNSLKDL